MNDRENEESSGMERIDEILSEFLDGIPGSRREYDEEEAFMSYVWRSYPEIMRPHQCVASAEQVCEKLPPEFRDEYWQHASECRKLVHESVERDKQASNDEEVITSMPLLPSLRPELLDLSFPISQELEKQLFWKLFLPHQDQVSINRCPNCEKILFNDKTRQCLWCKHD